MMLSTLIAIACKTDPGLDIVQRTTSSVSFRAECMR